MKTLIESGKGWGKANGLWAGGGLRDRLTPGRRRPSLMAGAALVKRPIKRLTGRLTGRRESGGNAKWIWAGVGLLVAAGVVFNLKELIRYIKIARM